MWAEDADELIELAAGLVRVALSQGCGERAFVAAGEADESFGMFFEFFMRDGAFAFLGAQLHFGDQAAEILVAGAGGDEQGKAECFVTSEFCHSERSEEFYFSSGLSVVVILRLCGCFTS